ncbi:MAG: helix-turn-helix transcriptional regulator, partial [Clostridia bacterium]|nr:helix-turn-helix transcriptional regulator [Clostridia bacterium]
MLNELIKKYRQDNDLTQQELANKLFVTRSAVAKWEQGRGFPSEDILEKLSQLINVPTEQLLSEKELRSLTVENTNIVKKHKNFLYFIIPLIVLLIISVSVLFLISLAPKEQAPQLIIYTKDAYNVAKVENNTLTFNVEQDVEVNIELTDENNKN